MDDKKRIIEEIHTLYIEDQRMRITGPWDDKVDIKNTDILKNIVINFGWPTITKFGLTTANEAMIIAIHSRKSPDTQEYFLNEVTKVLIDVPLNTYALLYDNVYLKKEGKQKYGTQFKIINGIAIPLPIKDFKKVNKYRKEVGLEPLEEYLNNYQEIK